MYNGIGLQSARGSGTNGYVQRNLSFIKQTKPKVEYRTEDDLKKLDAYVNRTPNQDILLHQRKRQIEVKCYEIRENMEQQGYSTEEIDAKVMELRELLIMKAEDSKKQKEWNMFDDNGKPIVKETHQMAELNHERNNKLKDALGISQYFIEGSSLDPSRKAKEALAKSEAAIMQQKKYQLLRETPSPEPKAEQKSKGTKEPKSIDKHKKETKRKSSREKHSRRSNSSDDDDDSESTDSERETHKKKRVSSRKSHSHHKSRQSSSKKRRSYSSSSETDSSDSSSDTSSDSSDSSTNSSKSSHYSEYKKPHSHKRKHSSSPENPPQKEKRRYVEDNTKKQYNDSNSRNDYPKKYNKEVYDDERIRDRDLSSKSEKSPKLRKCHSRSLSLSPHSRSDSLRQQKRDLKDGVTESRGSFAREIPKSYAVSVNPKLSLSKSPKNNNSRYSLSPHSHESKSPSRSISSESSSHSNTDSSSSRSRSRSPSIPRHKGSPSFLDKRRITSARKRPVPYKRMSPVSVSSDSTDYSRYRSRSRSLSNSSICINREISVSSVRD